MLRRTLALTGIAAAAWLAASHAQTPVTPVAPAPQTAAPQRPVFRGGIDAVSVDAIVTDSKGNPVTDLTRDDFEIREANKPQTIDAFKLIHIDDTVDLDPARYPEIHSIADQEREAARDDVRLIVVFLDDYHVQRGNDVSIREQIARFVRQLSPRDLVAVMYPLTPPTDLTLTRNHEGTADAILKFVGRKYDYSPRNEYEAMYERMSPQQIEDVRNQVTTAALASICTYLGTIRDGRKSILFVSEGFSGTLPLAVSQRTLGLPPTDPTLSNVATQAAIDRGMSLAAQDVLRWMQSVFEEATRSNTAVYPLDPRGLPTSEFGPMYAVDAATDQRVLSESTDSLRTLADQTGGQAILNFNDVALPLKQMIHDTSAYYLLGYTSTESKHDGQFHAIKVSIKRKGLTVRARKGYWAYSEEDVAKAAAPRPEGPPADVAAALTTLAMPSRGHAVRTWIGLDRRDDGQTSVTLVWEATAQPGGRDEMPDLIDVLAGSASGDLAFQGRVPKDPQAAQPSGRVTFAAKPGALHVRLAVKTADGTQLDADSVDVTVPDFTKVGPAISTPQVFRARTVRDVQQLSNGSTELPAASREFSRTERLVIHFHAYGPGESGPIVTLRLLNRNGEVITVLPAPTRGADGTYQADLPLAGLAAGEFVLEVAAATPDGAKTRTLVAFSVTA